MIVVADASPLNYLIQIDEVDLLQVLYETVMVPPSVQQELLHERAPAKVIDWVSHPPGWLMVREPLHRSGSDLTDLDAGERDAVELALESHANLVLMDEWLGRARAEALHLVVTGTIGVLEEAARRTSSDIGATLNKLFATNFRISAAYKRRILEKHKL